ncbi:hypothetical protein BDV24DRAFT_169293 [Aspergillus arachidicola]|uniref:Uncharacterized protein n=1 Tax=Aspergillus arachidicola TaxID=656916 RepID=A0A5N6XQ90_9EURO|nr:hypothetical protein BDV24DRAFT_169293 [Aspergillus arachidicola]
MHPTFLLSTLLATLVVASQGPTPWSSAKPAVTGPTFDFSRATGPRWKEPDSSKCRDNQSRSEDCLGTQQYCARGVSRVKDEAKREKVQKDCEASRGGRPSAATTTGESGTGLAKLPWMDPNPNTCRFHVGKEICIGTAQYCKGNGKKRYGSEESCLNSRQTVTAVSQVDSNGKLPWKAPSGCRHMTEDCQGSEIWCYMYESGNTDACLSARQPNPAVPKDASGRYKSKWIERSSSTKCLNGGAGVFDNIEWCIGTEVYCKTKAYQPGTYSSVDECLAARQPRQNRPWNEGGSCKQAIETCLGTEGWCETRTPKEQCLSERKKP